MTVSPAGCCVILVVVYNHANPAKFSYGKGVPVFAAGASAHTRVKPKQALRRRTKASRRAAPTLPRRPYNRSFSTRYIRSHFTNVSQSRPSALFSRTSLARGGRLARWLEPISTFTNGARATRSGWLTTTAGCAPASAKSQVQMSHCFVRSRPSVWRLVQSGARPDCRRWCKGASVTRVERNSPPSLAPRPPGCAVRPARPRWRCCNVRSKPGARSIPRNVWSTQCSYSYPGIDSNYCQSPHTRIVCLGEFNARPHPGPLPRERGRRSRRLWKPTRPGVGAPSGRTGSYPTAIGHRDRLIEGRSVHTGAARDHVNSSERENIGAKVIQLLTGKAGCVSM